MEIKTKTKSTIVDNKPIKEDKITKITNTKILEEDSVEDINDHNNDNNPRKNEKRGRVFVRNLPFKLITSDELKSSLSTFGEITEVNLPVNEKGQSKGFGFVQFKTRKEALKAIKEAINLMIKGRRISLSLAMAQEEYKEKESEIQLKEKENKLLQKKRNKEEINKDTAQAETEEEPKINRPLLNDPSRTLFVRNLGFNTDEDRLKGFFSTYGKVLYAKIVRDKVTKVSKGTGFVMFHHQEELEGVLELYKKHSENYEKKNNKFSKNKAESEADSLGLNPFELDDRHLYIFQAMTKENAQELDKKTKSDKTADKRCRELLYYGLSESTVQYFLEENRDVSEEDQEKREALIKLKKIDFTKNPNLHVSKTRITIRNIEKNVDEDKLREIIREKLIDYEKTLSAEEKKEYNKVKKIKQIKLLRHENELGKDNQPKSKCVAFVEVCDFKVAKALINLMSNMKLNKKSKKGLMVDFSLDDIRKIQTRLNKIKILNDKKQEKAVANGDNQREAKKQKKIAKNTQEVKPDSQVSILEEKKKSENSIENISDVKVLLDLYEKTVSRGKKQRIKKKLRKLGVNPPPTMDMKIKEIDNTNDFFSKNNSSTNANDVYTTKKIDNDNTNINKKIQEDLKKVKTQDGEKNSSKMLNNKRVRNDVGEDPKTLKNKKARKDEISSRKSANSKIFKDVQNVNAQTKTNSKTKTKNSKSFEYDDVSDSDGMDEEMNPYYSQILQNLNRK